MANPAPGFARHPNHAVIIGDSMDRVRVSLYGCQIADADGCKLVQESGYPAVHYLNRADVDMSRLRPSSHSTYCPFKGTARYFDIRVPDGDAQNAVWSYEDAYDETAELNGMLAFYADRVDVEITAAE